MYAFININILSGIHNYLDQKKIDDEALYDERWTVNIFFFFF